MKLLAFAASTSRASINKRLVTHAAEVFGSDVLPSAQIEIVDLNDYEMPIYSSDREADGGVPDLAKKLFEKIGEADALLVSYAEHNGNYSAAWKNTFDWMSRINAKVFQDTPMVALSTSPGKGGAGSVLALAVNSAGFFGADLKASMSVPSFGEKFDIETGRLSDPALSEELLQSLKGLSEGL